eukprot:1258302-Alexandrium_andersonii.AAC.1
MERGGRGQITGGVRRVGGGLRLGWWCMRQHGLFAPAVSRTRAHHTPHTAQHTTHNTQHTAHHTTH